MNPKMIQRLRGLTSFPSIFSYLRDELNWPLDPDNIQEEEITFEYTPDELGLAEAPQKPIRRIRQLRELDEDQPWSVFYIEFDNKNLPVTVLRSILKKLTSVREDLPGWDMEDLLFITVQGTTTNRSVAFSHFRKGEGKRLPELRSFSWDSGETHFYYIQNLNLENLTWQKRNESTEEWRDRWRNAFLSRPKVVIGESKQLAGEMATQARFMRDAIVDVYRLESENGAWHKLKTLLEIDLVNEELNATTFADVIAQTITYGLFSAAEQKPDVELVDLVDAIPKTNPFLSDLLQKLVQDPNIDLIALGIDRLLELYRGVDFEPIVQQFMRWTDQGKEETSIHFYEYFLQAYDATQRAAKGVYYTPDPVVHYIVHSVDQILKHEFDITDGLASAERDDDGQHRVQILDPATGTGTFLAHVIDLVHTTKSGMKASAWNEYVAEDLLPRLNGFELMMAPYAIAHMKLGLKLEQTGYKFESDQRLRVFLTNALSAPVQSKDVMSGDFLAQEADAANRVKKQKRIMVVLGNPPYSNFGQMNQNNWIMELLDTYKKELNEKKTNLNDDYIKFIRFAQWKINETGYGVLAYITNNSFLDGLTHRVMRRKLLEDFDKVFVINLHGNSMRGEVTPDGNKDENVFDIQVGVSIIFLVKHTSENSNSLGTLYYQDFWGLRTEKYNLLNSDLSNKSEFQIIQPEEPHYFFVPTDAANRKEYYELEVLEDVMPIRNAGIVTARDALTVHMNVESLIATIEQFANLSLEKATEHFSLYDSRDWKVSLAQEDLQASNLDKKYVQAYLYRPFDIRHTFYTGKTRGFISMPGQDVMRHMLQDNLSMIAVRQIAEDNYNHFYVSRHLIDNRLTSSNRGYAQIFPLYLYPDNRELFDTSEWELSEKGRRPNFDRDFVDTFAGQLGLQFITDGRGDLVNTFGPEDIFHYAYAIFHSPTYRTRYVEFLKIDFPRLPLTSDIVLFNKLVQRGADLVALHLLDDDYVAASWVLDEDESPLVETGVAFVERENGRQIGKLSKSSAHKNGRVLTDTSNTKNCSYFEGVPKSIWEFQIGGYQVLHKWLHDRSSSARGVDVGYILTTEDIEHYKRIVASLHHTMLLMEEIDKIIDSHGGYPIVGSQDTEDEDDMTDFPQSEKDMFGYRDDQRAFGDISTNSTDESLEEQPDTNDLFDLLTDGTEPEDTGNDQMEPFDPDEISIETQYFSLDLILGRIRTSSLPENVNKKMRDGINLSPAFQRKAGIWNDRKQSRLIESIFLRIPLPVFYVAEDQEVANHWIVVDGLQRLTTLKRFVINQELGLPKKDILTLKDLEFWGETLNGKTWNEIPSSLQVRLKSAQVVVHVIKRRTPEVVRFNVFKRINTGGMPLSGQEIRHALNQGRITEFLGELADSDEFLTATDNGVSPKRQADRECVLRFIAFSEIPYTEYSDRDNLDTFFNKVMKAMNQPEAEGRYDAIEERFKKSMRAAHAIFGNNAFRKWNSSSRRSPVSKALFEVWSVILGHLDDKQIESLQDDNRNRLLIRKYRELQRNDQDFMRAISYSTGNTRQVKDRFSKVEQLVMEVLND